MVDTLAFPEFLKPTLDDIVEKSQKLESEQFSKVFKMETSEDAFEDDYVMQYPSEVAQVAEGGAFVRIDIEPVRSKRYQMVSFKSEIKVTLEMIDDNKYGKAINAARALGLGFKRTVERIAARIFYQGLAGTYTTPDGAAVFGTHNCANPDPGNPTSYSNKITNKLNHAGLKAGLIKMMTQLDEKGNPAPAMANQLIVSPFTYFEGKSLIGSKLNPDNANNESNELTDGLELVLLTFLQEDPLYASNAWYLRDKNMSWNKFYWRKKPITWVDKDPDTGDYLYRVMGRCCAGVTDPAGLVGSDGSGS